MTVAAIDRLVHHGGILEMKRRSFRQRAAVLHKKGNKADAPATTINRQQNEGED